MTATHKIKRQSLPETLAESLRERILNGEFKQGEPLVQDAIAQEYGVSRMPVREALRQLESTGLITMEVHRGAVVTCVSPEAAVELFELRALLECELLRRAVPRMTDEHLDESRSILAVLESAYEKGDIASWGRLNWEFHRSLYAAADRPQTLGVLQGVHLQTDRYIRLQLLLTKEVDAAQNEHLELLRLCKSGNVERAVAYLRKHILSASRGLLGAMKKNRAVRAA